VRRDISRIVLRRNRTESLVIRHVADIVMPRHPSTFQLVLLFLVRWSRICPAAGDAPRGATEEVGPMKMSSSTFRILIPCDPAISRPGNHALSTLARLLARVPMRAFHSGWSALSNGNSLISSGIRSNPWSRQKNIKHLIGLSAFWISSVHT